MLTFKDKQKTVHKRVKVLRENATPSELKVLSLLIKLNERFIFQQQRSSGYWKGLIVARPIAA